jgi:hypothetical protein
LCFPILRVHSDHILKHLPAWCNGGTIPDHWTDPYVQWLYWDKCPVTPWGVYRYLTRKRCKRS